MASEEASEEISLVSNSLPQPETDYSDRIIDPNQLEDTVQSTKSNNSETSLAVKALEQCYDSLQNNDDHDGKSTLNEKVFSSSSEIPTTNNLIGITSEQDLDSCDLPDMNDSSNPILSQPSGLHSSIGHTITPSQVLDFDENAQYKVEETPPTSKSKVHPEFEANDFKPEQNDPRSIKSCDVDISNVITDSIVNNALNVDETSVCSSVPPASEASENSQITFPDKIKATDSINGDVSSDAEFINRANVMDSMVKSEESNDIVMTGISTPEPNQDSSSNMEPPTQPAEPVPSTSTVSEGPIYPVDNLFEYQWPQESGSEWFMLQEQICEFLQVKSFKRKYPELTRRVPAQEEKEFLRMRGVVTEYQCDLGLTALKADEVHELMMKDYPQHYKQYAKVLHEKEKQNFKDKLKRSCPPKLDKVKFEAYRKKAVKSASEFNTQFQRERREERRAYLDLQTMAIHYPSSKRKVLPPEMTKPGAYPVALMPGQYQDYYKIYTRDELKYLPINTVIYGPPKTFSLQETMDITRKSAATQADDSTDSPVPEPPPPEKKKTTEDKKVAVEEPAKEKAIIPVEKPRDENARCRVCEIDDDNDKKILDKNSAKINEDMVQCSECSAHGHPSCLDLTTDMVAIITKYPWQCMECKTCIMCRDPYDEDKMMFCDRCDRGYHTFCVGLRGLPTGRWECQGCSVDTPHKIKKARKERSDKGVSRKDRLQQRAEQAKMDEKIEIKTQPKIEAG